MFYFRESNGQIISELNSENFLNIYSPRQNGYSRGQPGNLFIDKKNHCIHPYHRKKRVQPTLIFLSTVIICYFFVTRWRTKINTISAHDIFRINEKLLPSFMTNRICRNRLKCNYFAIIASFLRLKLICLGGMGIIHYLEID